MLANPVCLRTRLGPASRGGPPRGVAGKGVTVALNWAGAPPTGDRARLGCRRGRSSLKVTSVTLSCADILVPSP